MQHVAHWMTAPAITVSETTTLPDARGLMLEHGIRRVPVVDAVGCLVGIVTEGDVAHVSGSPETDVQTYDLQHIIRDLPIRAIMKHPVLTVTAHTHIAEAARLMWEHRINGLPVVEGDQVVGVLSASDLFRFVMATESVVFAPDAATAE